MTPGQKIEALRYLARFKNDQDVLGDVPYTLLEWAADEIERLTAALVDLRERSAEEGIHHFVKRIDAALEYQQAVECVFECRAADGSVGGMFSNNQAWCRTHGFDCPKLQPDYQQDPAAK